MKAANAGEEIRVVDQPSNPVIRIRHEGVSILSAHQRLSLMYLRYDTLIAETPDQLARLER
ncbi:MAG: hypothetical protein AAF624_15135, partial [Bacteroidota bacterium]